jgi:hypothetical protein
MYGEGGLCKESPFFRVLNGLFAAGMTRSQTMDMQPPPILVQVQQPEVPPSAPVEPSPIEVNVSQYIPETARAVTMIVTLTPPTGQALIYAPGHETDGTLFKGPRSIDEVKLSGPILYVKLYGATKFDIQYTNYRQPD